MVRDYCMFICLDDKHNVKIGEPDFPVVSAKSGMRVPMAVNVSLQAGDHDFTIVVYWQCLCRCEGLYF